MNRAERNAEIFRLHNEGRTNKEIAEKFNLTAKGVKYIVNQMNNRFAAAEKFNLVTKGVKQSGKDSRFGSRADKAERNKKIVEMYHEGLTFDQIAKKVGLKRSGVSYVLRKEIQSGRENIRIRNESIFNMHSAGFSVREIAKRFDLTDAGVRYILKHNKVDKIDTPIDTSLPIEDKKEAKRPLIVTCNSAIEIFVRRYSEEYTTEEIANMWGVNVESVSSLKNITMEL